jgi:YD repeat-containing protein
MGKELKQGERVTKDATAEHKSKEGATENALMADILKLEKKTGPEKATAQSALHEKINKYDDELHKKGGPLYGKNDIHVVGVTSNGKLLVSHESEKGKVYQLNEKGAVEKSYEQKSDREKGTFTITHSDGSSTTKYRDGSTVEKVKGSDGTELVTKTTDNKGKTTAEYSYDTSKSPPELNQVKESGDTWKKTGENEWQCTDGNHKGHTWKGKIEVNQDDGSKTETWMASGFNNATVKTDAAGKVTEVKDSKNETTKYSYNDAGELNKITYNSGDEWTNDKGTWKCTKSSDSSKVNQTWTGTIEVDENGNRTETKQGEAPKIYSLGGNSGKTDNAEAAPTQNSQAAPQEGGTKMVAGGQGRVMTHGDGIVDMVTQGGGNRSIVVDDPGAISNHPRKIIVTQGQDANHTAYSKAYEVGKNNVSDIQTLPNTGDVVIKYANGTRTILRADGSQDS